VLTLANTLGAPFWYTITLPARSVQNRRPSGANARAVGKLAASGKAEAGGPESPAGGAVVAGLVGAGALGLAGETTGLGGAAVVGDGEGLGTGWEAVAVTVAVTEAAALGDGPVFAFFWEQEAVSSTTAARRASKLGGLRMGGVRGSRLSRADARSAPQFSGCQGNQGKRHGRR
jgi:hypothetical protein